MSIKSIDFQILIPKTPEIHKIRQSEINSEKNTAQAAIIKSNEIQNKALKQVNKSHKPYKTKIDKDGQRENTNSFNDNNDKRKTKRRKKKDQIVNARNRTSRIDIRI